MSEPAGSSDLKSNGHPLTPLALTSLPLGVHIPSMPARSKGRRPHLRQVCRRLGLDNLPLWRPRVRGGLPCDVRALRPAWLRSEQAAPAAFGSLRLGPSMVL